MKNETQDMFTWGDTAKMCIVATSPIWAGAIIDGAKDLIGGITDGFGGDDGDLDTESLIGKLV